MCLSHFMAEVTHCKQANINFGGNEDICSESLSVMDYEDFGRLKRYFGTTLYIPESSIKLMGKIYIRSLNFRSKLILVPIF